MIAYDWHGGEHRYEWWMNPKVYKDVIKLAKADLVLGKDTLMPLIYGFRVVVTESVSDGKIELVRCADRKVITHVRQREISDDNTLACAVSGFHVMYHLRSLVDFPADANDHDGQ